MALWASTEPVVATFHSAMLRSRALHAAHPLLRPSLEKIRGRIAVSEDARATVQRHLGGEAFIIPNGVSVDEFSGALPRPEWRATPDSPTFAFLGRVDEPRKGLQVALAALPAVLDVHPGARLLIAGPGDAAELLRGGRPASGRREHGAGHGVRRRQGGPAALRRRLRRATPRWRELRHRARRGHGGRRAGRGLRPAGLRGRARRGPHRRAVRDRFAPRRCRERSSTWSPTATGGPACAPWASPGRGCSTGTSWPTG